MTATTEVPVTARRFVIALLTLLVVPGLIGFDAWPLTGWRLFSLSRDRHQTRWEIGAVDAAGTTRVVDLDELPLGYRHAEWVLVDLADAGESTRDHVCRAMLEGVRHVEPRTVEITILRNRQSMSHLGGDWVIRDDREVFHRCRGRQP